MVREMVLEKVLELVLVLDLEEISHYCVSNMNVL